VILCNSNDFQLVLSQMPTVFQRRAEGRQDEIYPTDKGLSWLTYLLATPEEIIWELRSLQTTSRNLQLHKNTHSIPSAQSGQQKLRGSNNGSALLLPLN